MAKVLLRQHLWLLGMLAISATMGAAWLYVWQQASAESLRINVALREAQRLYTDVYRQAQEASIASRAPDNMSIAQYWDHVYDMDARFERIERTLDALGTPQATAGMRHAYNMMQIQLNVLLTEEQHRDSDRLIDAAVERWINGSFGDAYSGLTRILDAQSTRIAQRLNRWNRLAMWLFPMPILVGILFVFFSHRNLQTQFSKPMQQLSEGATRMAQGDLDHRIVERGVAETRSLAVAINTLATDLHRAREPVLERERQNSLERLIPIVAHNIRNPLASIRAVAQATCAEDSAEERLESRDAIIATVDRLERWTSSLLGYLNPFVPNRSEIEADELVTDLIGMVGSHAAERQIRVLHSGTRNCRFQADRNLLEQALFGLLLNAVEASPAGAEVRISVACGRKTTSIQIEDQGPGMPFIPDANQRGPGPSTKTHGTGIGIPFALRVCQAHRGSLAFHNASYGGTIASLTLGSRQ